VHCIVIKKVKHNSMHVYNECVDGMTWLTKDVTTKEQKRKNDVKAKAFFPRRSSHAEKNSTNRSAKMHDSDRHFRLEKFFVNCCAHVGKNKKVIAIALLLYFNINTAIIFTTKVKKLFTTFIEFARRWW